MSGFNLGTPAGGGTGGFSFGTGSSNSVPASSGFTFGAPATTSTTSSTTGGFSFGTTPATTTAPTTASTGGGFSFGAPATTTTAAPAAAPASTGFSFGSTTAASKPPATSTGFSFGTTGTTTTSTTGGFNFGTQATASAQPVTSNPVLVAPPVGNTPLPSGAYLPGGLVHEYVDPIIQRINNISRSIDPLSPDCRLQFVLYNFLPANSPFRGKLVRPVQANEELWQEGIRHNPDPELYVPCFIAGWDDLLIRLKEQDIALRAHMEAMRYLSSQFTAKLLTNQQCISQGVFLAESKQAVLERRLFHLINRVELLRAQNVPIQQQEVVYYRQLLEMKSVLESPELVDKIKALTEYISMQSTYSGNNNSSDQQQQQQQLSSQQPSSTQQQQQQQKQQQQSIQNNASTNRNRNPDASVNIDEGNATLDDSTLENILQMLSEQGQLINALVQEVEDCRIDVQTCQEVLQGKVQ